MEITSTKEKTVLHVVGGVERGGGVMRVAIDLAHAPVICTRSYVWKSSQFEVAGGDDVFVLEGKAGRTDLSLGSDLKGALQDLLPLLRWSRGRKNMVLHAHSRMGIFISFFARLLTGFPVVIHFHALWQRKWLYRRILKLTNAEPVFNSAMTCRYFGFDPAQSVVLMPTVQWPSKPALHGTQDQFISAGSFVGWKNLDLIIRAFNDRRGDPKARLVLFGRSDRPVRPSDQDYILALTHTNQSIAVEDYDACWADRLSDKDVFVHAATDEPFGIVILEAFAKGCRCVVPEGTFLDDLPEPYRSRGVYRFRSMDEMALSQQMEMALSERQSAEGLWNLRRMVAAQFSINKAALKLSTVYDSVLQ
jgi:glycosyltransferase involved in cell wall biosynthesis